MMPASAERSAGKGTAVRPPQEDRVIARGSLSDRWGLYALLWWVMFVVGEVGQAIGPNYTWKEALAGILSETIYVPFSALVTNWLIGNRQRCLAGHGGVIAPWKPTRKS